MAYEFLQKLFGTTKEGEQPKSMTYEELVAAIGADNSISVVNLKDGGYVSKDKFDAKETELKGVQTQLATANETIKGFKDQDVDGIKQKVSEWETKYNTDTQALKDQLAQQARAHAEEMFLSGYKFTSKAARNGVLAELRSKNFTVENGTLLGGKEFIDSLMAQDDFKGAFVTETPNNGSQKETPPANNPRFAGPTNGGAGTGGNSAPTFDFGFPKVRKTEG